MPLTRATMADELSSISLADATITRVDAGDAATVRVDVRDWREAAVRLVFHDLIGVEALGAVGAELSGAGAVEGDPFLDRSCAAAGESPAGFRCFAFNSAWDDAPVLKIVAKSVTAGGVAGHGAGL